VLWPQFSHSEQKQSLAPPTRYGDERLLGRRKLALICSQKCPGDVILKTYDFARLVRQSGIAMVSGFHSSIEKHCLPILLRGQDPIIIVQGQRQRLRKSRLPREWQKAIDARRLLLLSPFSKKDKRVTAELAAAGRRAGVPGLRVAIIQKTA